MKLKAYRWAIEGIAALLLLVGTVAMMIIGVDEIKRLVVQVIGLGFLFFTAIRVKPIIDARDEKDYLIIMLLEILISFVVGVILLFFTDWVRENERIFTFSQFTGIVFYIRGIVHFYTTAKRYELHDLFSFIVHILLLSFGFLFLFNTLQVETIVYILYVLSFLLIGYFSYRTYNGYNQFRIEKMNRLKMQDFIEKKDKEEKKIDDPVSIEEQIQPKIIEEPQEERPEIVQ